MVFAFTLETPRGLSFYLTAQSCSMPSFVTFTYEQTHICYTIPETSCILIHLYYVCLYVYTYQLTDVMLTSVNWNFTICSIWEE